MYAWFGLSGCRFQSDEGFRITSATARWWSSLEALRVMSFIYWHTIRYDIFTCAQKLTKWPAIVYSARHRNKQLRKTKNKNRLAQKKRCRHTPRSVAVLSADSFTVHTSELCRMLCATQNSVRDSMTWGHFSLTAVCGRGDRDAMWPKKNLKRHSVPTFERVRHPHAALASAFDIRRE